MKKTIAICIASLFLIPIFFIMPTFVPTAGATTTWYNNDWYYSKKITIDHTKVAGDLTNFPVLISRTDTDFKKAQSDGDDFIFASADNATKYNHEIEKWDSSTGELVAWVNVTSLSSTVDTVLWMYYGNPACSSQQNVAGTWDSNYVVVYHMKDTTTSTITDSTSNGYTGTKKAANTPNQITGKINKAQDFSGSDYIDCSPISSLSTPSTMTIELWVYSHSVTAPKTYVSKYAAGNGWLFRNDAEGKFSIDIRNNPSWEMYQTTNVELSVNNWQHLAIVYDSGQATKGKLYVNGTEKAATKSGSSTIAATPTTQLSLGRLPVDGHYYDGLESEVRISNIVRSANWISTGYNNQNSPSTFMSFGNENNGGVKTWYHSDWKYCKQITINHSYVGGTLTNFPVLVSRTDTDLKHAQSDGDDFIFIAADNITKYNHEIEKWDSASGILVAWVNITSLSSTTDTILYLYYGNTACSSQQSVAGTWNSDYVMVQHMNDITTSTISDSTSYGNNGAKKAASEPTQIAGRIGYGQDFDGANDYVSITDATSLDVPTAFTLEYWIKPDTIPTATNSMPLCKYSDSTGGDQAYRLMINCEPSAGILDVFAAENSDPGNQFIYRESNARQFYVGNWYHVVGIWDGGSTPTALSEFINGSIIASTGTERGNFVTLRNSAQPVRLGCGKSGASLTYWYDGIIDEPRISKIARSSAWISTEYNNTNSPSTFMTFGNEQTTWYDTSFLYRQKITINHNKVDADLTNFPVLVKTTMDTTKVQADGDDLLFTSSAGVKLNHEIEAYNSTSGELVSWVNVTSVSMSAPDTYIYLYYGNTTCSSQQNVAGTWDSDYVLVAHMNMESGNLVDSTSYKNNGTIVGGTPDYRQAGKMGYAINFEDASSEYFSIPSSSSLTPLAKMCLEAWTYLDSTDNTNSVVLAKGSASNNREFHWKQYGGSTNNFLDSSLYETAYTKALFTRCNSVWTSAWHSASLSWTGGHAVTDIYSYKDGVLLNRDLTEDNGFTHIDNTGSALWIGGCQEDSSGYYHGVIDEVRISKIDRSTTWLSTEYKNQNDSANFTIFGTIDGGGTPASNNAPNTPTGLSPTARQTSTSVSINATGSDPDGGSLYLYFYNNDTKAEIDHVNISNNTQGTVAWSGLTRGNTYTFYARGYDGTLWGTNSTTCTFTVNSLPVCTGFMTENLTDPTHIINILPYFSWGYSDGDSDTQVQYEVEVGTTNNSNNIWDPSVVTSSNHYAIYAGSSLTRGQLYYVRVRVNDGYEWSEW